MRKSLVLLSALFILLAGGVCVAAIAVHQPIDQVIISPAEWVLEPYVDTVGPDGQPAATRPTQVGNSAMLEGLEVTIQSFCGNLFWNTHFIPSENTVQTQFQYRETYDDPTMFDSTYGMEMNNITTVDVWGYEGALAEDADGLARAVLELEQATPPGEMRETVVRLRDYEEFYTFSVDIFAPHDSFRVYQNWRSCSDGEKKLFEDFQNFFRIPVLEDERLELSVTKNEKGTVYGHGGSRSGSEIFIMNVTYDTSTVTSDAVLFTFSNKTSRGNPVDTSLIPGGYGIYRIPFADNDEDANTMTGCGFNGEALKMVYPLREEGMEVLKLHTSLDKSRLLLHTIEDGEYILTVIDIETMTELQRIPYAPADGVHDSWLLWDDQEQDIFLVQISGKKYFFFAKQEDRSYHMEFDFDREGNLIDNSSRTDMAYDGERLVVGRGDAWQRNKRAKSLYNMKVYDKTGLCYMGDFRSSLSEEADDNRVEQPRHTSNNAIKVNWMN